MVRHEVLGGGVGMTCTWKDCEGRATHEEEARGVVWARLCDEHHEELDDALTNFNAKKLIRAWARAKGGHPLSGARP